MRKKNGMKKSVLCLILILGAVIGYNSMEKKETESSQIAELTARVEDLEKQQKEMLTALEEAAKAQEEKEQRNDDRPLRLYDAGTSGGREIKEKLFLCRYYLRNSQYLQIRGTSGHSPAVWKNGDRYLERYG